MKGFHSLIKAANAVLDMVEAIAESGGVYKNTEGYWVLAMHPDWASLGEAYMAYCEASDIEPVIYKEDVYEPSQQDH